MSFFGSRHRRDRGWGGWPSRPKADKRRYQREHPDLKPVCVDGRDIAKSFWGRGWCGHFESMADFDNRLPRGRTYCRDGSILHLELAPGAVGAVVAGGDFYDVVMNVKPLPPERWRAIKEACQGSIATVIDLLKGKLSPEIMRVICHPETGMFPLREEISWKCSCPDWASLCKHVASVFYGIGHRLDQDPGLIFTLRGVDPAELAAGTADSLVSAADAGDDLLEGDLGAIFGIEVEPEAPPAIAARCVEESPPEAERRQGGRKERPQALRFEAGRADSPEAGRREIEGGESRRADSPESLRLDAGGLEAGDLDPPEPGDGPGTDREAIKAAEREARVREAALTAAKNKAIEESRQKGAAEREERARRAVEAAKVRRRIPGGPGSAERQKFLEDLRETRAAAAQAVKEDKLRQARAVDAKAVKRAARQAKAKAAVDKARGLEGAGTAKAKTAVDKAQAKAAAAKAAVERIQGLEAARAAKAKAAFEKARAKAEAADKARAKAPVVNVRGLEAARTAKDLEADLRLELKVARIQDARWIGLEAPGEPVRTVPSPEPVQTVPEPPAMIEAPAMTEAERIRGLIELRNRRLAEAAGRAGTAGTDGPIGEPGGLAPVEAPRGLTPLEAPRGLTPVEAPRGLTPVEAPRGLTPLEAPRGLTPEPRGRVVSDEERWSDLLLKDLANRIARGDPEPAPSRAAMAVGSALAEPGLGRLSGRDIRYLRDRAGLSVSQLAAILKVTRASVLRWESVEGVVGLTWRTARNLQDWGASVLGGSGAVLPSRRP